MIRLLFLSHFITLLQIAVVILITLTLTALSHYLYRLLPIPLQLFSSELLPSILQGLKMASKVRQNMSNDG